MDSSLPPGGLPEERAPFTSSGRAADTGDDATFTTSRRSFLATAAAGAAAFQVVGVQSATAAVERHGIQFANVVDLVEDYGADPTGQQPVDDAISQAASADTLVEVPDGEYLFAGEVQISSSGNVGFVAKDGASPRFVASDGFNDFLLNVYHLPGALFENIDIDIRPDNTTGGLRFDVEDQVHVENVEYLGRGIHTDSNVTNALNITVTNETGTGTIRNVTAKKGSAIGHYKAGDGREAVRIGKDTYGTVRIEDCHFEEFGNNALYCSRTPGTVEVIGGTYRNNNVASVRIGGATSFVEGATIEVDLDAYTGPLTLTDSAYNTGAIRLEQRNVTKTPGAQVRDCDIRIKRADSCDAAIEIVGETGELQVTILNSRIQVDEDGVPAVLAKGSQVTIDGTSLTGGAANDCAVFVRGADASGSVVQNSCIEQSGSSRDGVRVKDALDCSVLDSNANVTGEAVTSNTLVEVLNLTTDDSCPLPSFVEDPLPNTISLEGGSESDPVTYEFTVSDDIAKGTDADDNDTVSGSTASGQVANGTDTFTFSGYITRFDHDGPLTVTLNGESFPASEWRNLPHSLVIEGENPDTISTYAFEVSGSVAHDPTIGSVNREDGDAIDGTTATGQVSSGIDAYRLSGDIAGFSHDGSLTVTLNGQVVDPSQWADTPTGTDTPTATDASPTPTDSGGAGDGSSSPGGSVPTNTPTPAPTGSPTPGPTPAPTGTPTGTPTSEPTTPSAGGSTPTPEPVRGALTDEEEGLIVGLMSLIRKLLQVLGAA